MVYILEILFYIKIIFNTKAKNKIENSLNIYKPSDTEWHTRSNFRHEEFTFRVPPSKTKRYIILIYQNTYTPIYI